MDPTQQMPQSMNPAQGAMSPQQQALILALMGQTGLGQPTPGIQGAMPPSTGSMLNSSPGAPNMTPPAGFYGGQASQIMPPSDMQNIAPQQFFNGPPSNMGNNSVPPNFYSSSY